MRPSARNEEQPVDAGIRGSFSWLMLDRAGRVVVGVVVGIAVARHLGPAEFGVLSFSLALTGIFAVVTNLGFDEVLVRDLSRGNGVAASWPAAWRLRVVAAVASWFGAVAAAWLFRPDSGEAVAVTAIVAAGLLFAPCELVECWFHARQRMRPPALARQTVLWLAALWRLALVLADAPLRAFAWASLVEAAAVGLVLLALYRRERGNGSAGESAGFSGAWRLLRDSWPLTASSFLVILVMQADRLLLGRFGGDAAVGTYAAATRLTEVFYALPLAVGGALMPRLTRLRAEEPPAYWQLVRRAHWGVTGACAVCSGLLALAGPGAVPLVFGPGYAATAKIVVVHCWILGLVAMVSLRSRLLVIEGGTHWIFLISLLTAVLNVAANLVLIPRYGGIGAAWAALAAWGFSALLAPWLFPGTRALAAGLFRAPRTAS